MGIWLYPEKVSMKDNNKCPATTSIIWLIRGSGKLSFEQVPFKFLKFMQSRDFPHFFGTNTTFDNQSG